MSDYKGSLAYNNHIAKSCGNCVYRIDTNIFRGYTIECLRSANPKHLTAQNMYDKDQTCRAHTLGAGMVIAGPCDISKLITNKHVTILLNIVPAIVERYKQTK